MASHPLTQFVAARFSESITHAMPKSRLLPPLLVLASAAALGACADLGGGPAPAAVPASGWATPARAASAGAPAATAPAPAPVPAPTDG